MYPRFEGVKRSSILTPHNKKFTNVRKFVYNSFRERIITGNPHCRKRSTISRFHPLLDRLRPDHSRRIDPLDRPLPCPTDSVCTSIR